MHERSVITCEGYRERVGMEESLAVAPSSTNLKDRDETALRWSKGNLSDGITTTVRMVTVLNRQRPPILVESQLRRR